MVRARNGWMDGVGKAREGKEVNNFFLFFLFFERHM